MSIFKLAFSSMIGRKIVMAVTGILLCLFLVGHLVGNFLLFVGREAFNSYATFLNSFKSVYFIELVLLLILFTHIGVALSLTWANKKARPQGYVAKKVRTQSTWMSSHMLHTGVVTMIFLVVHIVTFKFGEWDNTQIKYSDTLYDLVLRLFAHPLYSGFYLLCMIGLGFHLHHSIKSSFITLGITRKDSLELYGKLSCLFSLVIAVGFSSFPVYFYILSVI